MSDEETGMPRSHFGGPAAGSAHVAGCMAAAGAPGMPALERLILHLIQHCGRSEIRAQAAL